MKEVEYEQKWSYIVHLENIQAKSIQWYFTICAAVFAFLFSTKLEVKHEFLNNPSFPLLILTVYSALVCLRILAQKRVYEQYLKKLKELDGTFSENKKSVREKIISVFKIQYYLVCITAGLVAATFANMFFTEQFWPILIGTVYFLILCALSFTSLIGEE